MKGRESYWDSADWKRQQEADAAKSRDEMQHYRQLHKAIANITAPAQPSAPIVKRDADEPKVSAGVASYLAEWFAR